MQQNHLPATQAPPELKPPSGSKPVSKRWFAGYLPRISHRQLIVFGAVIPAAIYAFLAGIAILIISVSKQDLPDPVSLQTFKPALTTKVYDRNDSLVYEFYIERRDPIPLDSMPPLMVDAFVAVEDEPRAEKSWRVQVQSPSSLPEICF
jgi:membrane carboxypeptidase/penicillin-binding protein